MFICLYYPRYGQDHVLRWWPDLSHKERGQLASELAEVDLEEAGRGRGLVAQDPAQPDLGLEEVGPQREHEAMREDGGAVAAPETRGLG